MENNYWVSSSPHITNKKISNRNIYLLMLISLVPTFIYSIIAYGFRAVLIYFISALATVGTDIVFNLVKKRKFEFKDFSSIFVAVLIAMAMPIDVPIIYLLIACVVTNLFVKNCMGGVGCNFVSEVALTKTLVFIMMGAIFLNYYGTDGSAVNTVIDDLHNGVKPEGWFGLFAGTGVGAIGESSALCILIGGVALCVLKVIDYKVPVVYIASTFIFSCIFMGFGLAPYYILSGGVFFCAFYVATDFSTAPKTLLGKILCPSIMGLITVLIWKFGNYHLGAYYAVMICQLALFALKGFYVPKYIGEKK